MRSELFEFDPSSIGEVAPLLSLSPADQALLASDHPFLRYGEWRGFGALTGSAIDARVVASIDSRQRTGGAAVGCIGFVGLDDQPAASGGTRGISERVLAAAIGWLHARRIDTIRCPVEFSTWYGHRAMTSNLPDSGGPPAFPMEPRHGRPLVDLLLSSGFLPGHRAVSYAVDSTAVAASAAHAVARLREARMIDRPLHVPRLEEELQLFHQLSTDIFGDSWGFSEISLEEFRSIYRPLAQFVDAELVRILETPSGAAVGFGFGIPGVRHPRPGGFVIKTLGVLPRARHGHPGIGAGLTALIHQAARERGYVGGIHALMTQGSMAHRLSKRWGMHLRSYATFERSAP